LTYAGHRTINAGLLDWLRILHAAGIDLMEYGRAEESEVRDWARNHQHPGRRGFCTDVIGFTYGPEPEDWALFFEHPGDEYAGDFWESVEPSESIMPGVWPSEASYLDFSVTWATKFSAEESAKRLKLRRPRLVDMQE
jgi:hypothetical protein